MAPFLWPTVYIYDARQRSGTEQNCMEHRRTKTTKIFDNAIYVYDAAPLSKASFSSRPRESGMTSPLSVCGAKCSAHSKVVYSEGRLVRVHVDLLGRSY